MFNHILVPVDGSTTSNQAIEKTIAMAQAFKSTVTLVSVVDLYAFAGLGIDAAYGQVEYLAAAHAEAKLAIETAKPRFERLGIAVAASVVEGQVIYKTILEAAGAANADLIVMGSHGRKGLEKLVLGSVAAQVLSHTLLPVMIVRE
ncbi:MAG: universal stress protein [Polaromonas sp.]|nr:universal stress protein [Polaromonas sp.]